MKRINFKKQSGRSMVEMLGVLAIIGVLSVGAIAGYNMAMEKHRLNEAIEAVQLVIAETRTMYASQGNYNGLGNAISKDFMGVLAGGDSVAVKILERLKINTYYPIVIEPISSTNGISGMGFGVSVYDVPKSSCVRLYTMNWQAYGDDYGGVVGMDGGFHEDILFAEAEQFCKSLEFGIFTILFNPTRDYVEPAPDPDGGSSF